MKITIESDMPDEKMEPLVIEQVQSYGVFGYHYGITPFSRTCGDLSLLYERCCGIRRQIDRLLTAEQDKRGSTND